MEGNLEVCHRLLIALANPLQVDQAGGSCEVMRTVIHQEMTTGKSSLDYALEAGNAKISDSAL